MIVVVAVIDGVLVREGVGATMLTFGATTGAFVDVELRKSVGVTVSVVVTDTYTATVMRGETVEVILK